MHRERLDIAVKARFFRHLDRDNDPDAERLYRWHIEARNGGVEKGSWKRSVDDFVTAARDLLASMKGLGFDPTCPVVIANGGGLVEGAHRLSCAVVLDVPVWVRVAKGPAPTWGREWFVRHGLGEQEVGAVESLWDELHRGVAS